MDELEAMGLTAEVEYIPIDASKVPYNFSIKLGDRTYTMAVKYNGEGGFFTIDLSVMATGKPLCFGEPVRYGRPMFGAIEDVRYPIPVIVPFCLDGGINEVTFDNFGRTVQLYLHDRRTG